MKLLLFLLLCSICTFGQAKPDFKPCEEFMAQFTAQMDKFNAEHKKFQVNMSCTYSGDPNRVPKPVHRVALTPSEIETLHTLRRTEDAAFHASDAYERYLFRAHHIRKPEFGDPCWYFAGIISDTDYITIDLNLSPALEDNCQNINWRTK